MKKLLYISSILLIIVLFALLFPNNNVNAYTDEEYDQKMKESVAYAMSLIDDDMTDHEKAVIFAQYCQEGNVYSMTNNHQDPEGVFVDHTAVCAGYAKAFRLLCNTAGIPCETIVSQEANHEWNLCYLDGEWTYVDVTRGVNALPQSFNGKLFYTKDQIDYVTVRDKDGSTFSTTAEYAKENGLEILKSRYFGDAYYRYGGLNDDYYPEGTEYDGDFALSSNFSRIYYDEDYKYYEKREISATTSQIYKESRTTGIKTKLADAYVYANAITGIVKDNDKIYYIGTDGKSICSMDTDGNNKKKEYTHSGSETVSGVFVQDGYIKYALLTSETAKPTITQWKKLETGVSTGSYTVNNSDSKYILNYIKTSKGIVISSCEGIGSNAPSGEVYIPDTIDGMPVIGIGSYAFDDLQLEGELTLPENLEYIEDYAFQENNITKINFNTKLKSIGAYAFNLCANLTGTLEMSDSITFIGIGAFRDCYYDKIDFSENLIMIMSSTFSWNRNMDGVMVIPEGIISIADSAFRYTRIDAAVLPESFENLGSNVFVDYYSNNDFTDLAIKSQNMKSFYASDDYTIYLMSGTETSEYADNNNISYEDLRTAKPDIVFETDNLDLAYNSQNYELKYTVTPRFFEGYEKTWSSSNNNSVTVSSDGVVTPKNVGNATIYLTINGTKKGCTVNVTNPIPDGHKLTLNYYEYQLDGLNDTVTLKDEYILSGDITWTSTNEDVATVKNGVVTPKAGGFTYIKASTNNYGSDSCWIYVCALRTMSDGSKAYPGDLDRNGMINSNDTAMVLDWAKGIKDLTEDEIAIADANGDGAINANDAALIADIYSYGNFSPGEYSPITKITLNRTSLTINEGNTTKLTATITPTDTTDSPKITWTSSNEYIAKVDENGNVTSISGGEAIITAKTSNGLTATCTVTSNGTIRVQRVSGKITSYIDETQDIKIELIQSGTNTVINSVTLEGNATSYNLNGVVLGDYILRVTQGSTVNEYEISIGNEEVVQDVELFVLGDVNGDGKASPYDALLINKMFEEMKTPTEEQLAAGDIDGNGMLTPYDALMINLAFEQFRPVERVDR